MQDRFDKFTERARKVMSLAQEEAQRFNHNYIGTEHILLGLVAEGEGLGAKALTNLGVELEKARGAVEFIIGRGDRIVLGEVGLTPRSKKVIELAVDEARRLGHHYVGTEHLLLGLVREGEGIAAGVLESLGVTMERARSSVMEMLVQQGVTPAATMPPAAESLPGPMISVITLVCRDVAATQAFYVDYLGATVISSAAVGGLPLDDGERLIRMPFGAALLALRPASPEGSAVAAASDAGAVELGFFARTMHAPWALWNELRRRGAPGLSEVNSVPDAPNARIFTLTDPDGRTLRFHGMV